MPKIAYVVLSCAKFSDLWKPFFELQIKFWPEIGEDIFLATDSPYEVEKLPSNVSIIDYGLDQAWSDNLLKILDSPALSGFTHLFLMMEDGFFVKKVDNAKVQKIFSAAIELKANFVTLLDEPRPIRGCEAEFGEILKGSPYRPTATSSLWYPPVLKDILKRGESAWQFEKVGARRADKYDGFYACFSNVLILEHMVVKGRFLRGAINRISRLGVDVVSKRAEFSLMDTFKMLVYTQFRKFLFNITPPRLRRYLVRK